MKFAGHSAIAAAVALAVAPVASQAASIDRVAAPVVESTQSQIGDGDESSIRVVALVGIAVLILGLLTIIDDDDDAVSV